MIKTISKPKSKIQAVLFNNKFYDEKSAKLWLDKHNLKKIKPFHLTKNYLRARLVEPNNFKRMYIKQINKNIKFVIGFYN